MQSTYHKLHFFLVDPQLESIEAVFFEFYVEKWEHNYHWLIMWKLRNIEKKPASIYHELALQFWGFFFHYILPMWSNISYNKLLFLLLIFTILINWSGNGEALIIQNHIIVEFIFGRRLFTCFSCLFTCNSLIIVYMT